LSWWSSLSANESAFFWRILVAAFFAIGLWEILTPSRPLSRSLLTRWGSHTALFAVAIAMNSLIIPVGLVAGAFAIQRTGYGQFIGSHVPYAVRFVVAILLVDLCRYFEHYACHVFSPLWRIHSIHHSDNDFDLSTGFRHHPLEALFSQVVELAVILASASPPEAILVGEIASGVQSILMHANGVCPAALDRFFRHFFITPSFHLVHHSSDAREQNANFGILFPWWDRLFNTCIEQPRLGNAMQIGLDGVPERRALNVWYLLAMPFGKMPGTVETPRNDGLPSVTGTDRLAG
jgi:sterol desaturase/sphingolipid hydroxylase (fatty acid hydroxylase superfamily)